MKTKIAFLIDTIAFDTAGTEKQLLESIRRLDRSEFAPHLICLHESTWMASNNLPCECTILGYSGILKFNFFSVLSKLKTLLEREKFDIVQTYFEDSIFVAFLARLLSTHKPRLVSNRRDIGLGARNAPWYHTLFGLVRPYVHRRFDAIVANCKAVASYVAALDGLPYSKVTVLYNGVEIPPDNRDEPIPDLLLQFPDSLWVAIVASLTPVKRHDVLLHAFHHALTSEQRADMRLLVIGDGQMKVALHSLSHRLGISNRVHLVGATTNVSQYLRHVHVGVLSSDREGLSNAILEYMAHSIPVIATDVGGADELLSRNCGILVPPGDIQAMSTALLLMCRDASLRNSLGAEGRQRIEQNFSWERSMAAQEAFYRQLPCRPIRDPS